MAHALPSLYPNDYARMRMEGKNKDREEQIYLTGQIKEAEKAKIDFPQRKEASKKFRKGSIENRYSAEARQVVLPALGNLAITTTTREVATDDHITQKNCVFEVTQPMFEVEKGSYIPVHPDAINLIPQNNVFKLTNQTGISCSDVTLSHRIMYSNSPSQTGISCSDVVQMTMSTLKVKSKAKSCMQ